MFKFELGCLQSMPLFREVDAAKLKLLFIASSRVSFPAGETIVRQGAMVDAIHIVLEGEVEIVREESDKVVPVVRKGPGYVVGDLGLLLGEPHAVAYIAVTPVEALRVEGRVFEELLREVPQLSLAMMRDLARRLVELGKRYVEQVH